MLKGEKKNKKHEKKRGRERNICKNKQVDIKESAEQWRKCNMHPDKV